MAGLTPTPNLRKASNETSKVVLANHMREIVALSGICFLLLGLVRRRDAGLSDPHPGNTLPDAASADTFAHVSTVNAQR